jgi:hypothetical protein
MMSKIVPAKELEIEPCAVCGASGVALFGYGNPLVWYCAKHRLRQGSADRHLPAPVEDDKEVYVPVEQLMAQSVRSKDELHEEMQELDRKHKQSVAQLDRRYEQAHERISHDGQIELGRMLLTARAQVESIAAPPYSPRGPMLACQECVGFRWHRKLIDFASLCRCGAAHGSLGQPMTVPHAISANALADCTP